MTSSTATASTATASTATASAVTATATASAVATATASAAIFAGTRLVHSQVSAHELVVAEFLNGGLGLVIGGHRHETEAARPAGFPVIHNNRFGHRSCFSKQFPKVIFGGVPVQAADKHFITHFTIFSC
jgi:hypothetical protein